MMDKTLKCRDCDGEFSFTAGEQEFYASHGLMNEPGRCPQCRAIRKAQRNGGGAGAYVPRGNREMYAALCAECGSEARVPFLPRDDRPVYCSTCFDRVRASR